MDTGVLQLNIETESPTPETIIKFLENYPYFKYVCIQFDSQYELPLILFTSYLYQLYSSLNFDQIDRIKRELLGKCVNISQIEEIQTTFVKISKLFLCLTKDFSDPRYGSEESFKEKYITSLSDYIKNVQNIIKQNNCAVLFYFEKVLEDFQLNKNLPQYSQISLLTSKQDRESVLQLLKEQKYVVNDQEFDQYIRVLPFLLKMNIRIWKNEEIKTSILRNEDYEYIGIYIDKSKLYQCFEKNLYNRFQDLYHERINNRIKILKDKLNQINENSKYISQLICEKSKIISKN